MPSMSTAPPPTSARDRVVAWVRELVQFGLVGASAFLIDISLFNLLQRGPVAVLAGHPNTANAVAAATATAYSWVANRMWTYRGRTQDNPAREALLFAIANFGGLVITQSCLLVTHHLLGLTSALADNIAAYVVGFALSTAFRFLFYHYVVFTGTPQRPSPSTSADSGPANTAPTGTTPASAGTASGRPAGSAGHLH
ncbi:GtrA family protein [Actinomyces wuliandei]|uniref:GtrA family protein n=1 Tax=Actinomyces wuliandei TaxID=2057743 RepID=UPI000FDA0D94|nr:GtrA family protein [Actinomyces wuliandei]